MSLKEYLSLKEYKRVLQITRKPDYNEAKAIIKATCLGIAIIGLMGFVTSIVHTLLIA